MHITDYLAQAPDEPGVEPGVQPGVEPGVEHLDLHHVARVARQQGTRARRRRQGRAVLGSAAAVAVIAGGLTVVLGGGPGTDATGPAGASATATATSAPPRPEVRGTGPFTGRAVVAGLRHAVSAVAGGRASGFAGQASDEAYGQLTWTSADGRGASVVGINVQPGFDYVSSCHDPAYVRCTRSHPSPGSTLVSYEEHTPVAQGVGIRRVVDLLRADGTRVLVSATNGYERPHGLWDLTRPQPPLDVAQLTEVVSRPWWGAQLPTSLLVEGRTLSPYQDLGSAATPTAAASPSAG